jgi:uncharacterized protein YjbI with pentapeptide repeats
MADQEAFLRLHDGIEKWNRWRVDRLETQIDLSEVDLSHANLSGVNFYDVNLTNANLSHAILFEANLSRANLTNAILDRADLSGAMLRNANLTCAFLPSATLVHADLTSARLSHANLSHAYLIRTNFDRAYLDRAMLSHADLSNATLSDADLSESDLSGALLGDATLTGAMLSAANLTGTRLYGADLTEATLRKTILRGANLTATQILDANLSAADLTGACIEDWNINAITVLDDIVCDYIYLRQHPNTGEYQERRPHNGEFAIGDFARLVQKGLETVDLIFRDGIDWKAFLLSFQELQVQCGEENLSIRSIENKQDGALVIRLNVPPQANKSELERASLQGYEFQLQRLELQYRAELRLKESEIEFHKQKSSELLEIVKLQANRPITVEATAVSNQSNSEAFHNDYRYANIANQANKLTDNARQQANQYNYAGQKQDLAEAAKDIQQLLDQLSRTYPAETTPGHMTIALKAVEEIEKNPLMKQRVLGALKSGGTEALKTLIDHPAVSIILAAIEGWQKPD